MTDRPSTFGGTWTRDTRPTTGRSMRDLQDRAAFDQGPAAGASCALILALPLAGLLLAALLHTTGAVA